MSLNIDTLLLDIDYHCKTNGISSQASRARIAECEQRLQELIYNAINAEQLASFAPEYENVTLSHIPDIEIVLPNIDAQAFLNDTKRYFEQQLLPALLASFSNTLSKIALARASSNPLANKAWGESSDSVAQKKEYYLVQQLVKEREYCIDNVVSPREYTKFFNTLVNNGVLDLSFVKKQLQLFLPSKDHSFLMSYLADEKFTLLQKKHILGAYIQLFNLGKKGYNNSALNLSSKLLLRAHTLVKPSEMAQPNFSYYVKCVQEALLMDQSGYWLKACENWFNIVTHKTLKVSDFLGLDAILKRASGNSWFNINQPRKDELKRNNSRVLISDATFSFAKEIDAFKALIQLLEPFCQAHFYYAKEAERFQQITKLKQLLYAEKALPITTTIPIKQALFPHFFTIRAQNIITFDVNTRLAKLSKELRTYKKKVAVAELANKSSSKDFYGTFSRKPEAEGKADINNKHDYAYSNSYDHSHSHPHSSKEGDTSNNEIQYIFDRIFKDILSHLNALIAFSWLPITLTKQLESLANSLVAKKSSEPEALETMFEYNTHGLHQRLLAWGNFLVQFTHQQQLNSVRRLSPQEYSIFKQLTDLLNQFVGISGHDKDKNYLLVEKDVHIQQQTLYHLIASKLIRICDVVSFDIKPAIHHFIHQSDAFAADNLKNQILTWLPKNTGQQDYQVSVKDSPYYKCFQREFDLQKEVNNILLEFESNFELFYRDSSLSRSISISPLELNKQEVYTQVVQLLVLFHAWLHSDSTAQENKQSSEALETAIRKLMQVKNQMLQEDKTLKSSKTMSEYWWLPIVEDEMEYIRREQHDIYLRQLIERIANSEAKIKTTLIETDSVGHSANVSAININGKGNSRINKKNIDSDNSSYKAISPIKTSTILLVMEVYRCLTDIDLTIDSIEDNIRDKASSMSINNDIKSALYSWTACLLLYWDRFFDKESKSDNNGKRDHYLLKGIRKINAITKVSTWQKNHLDNLKASIQSLAKTHMDWPEISLYKAEKKRPMDSKYQHFITSHPKILHISDMHSHRLIWQSDLKEVSNGLSKRLIHSGEKIHGISINPLAIKKSLNLLKNYEKGLECKDDIEKISTISQQLHSDLKNLVVRQQRIHEGFYCGDAGIILLWPYLKTFFIKNNLLEGNKTPSFIDETAQLTARALLHYITGNILDENDDNSTGSVANILVELTPEAVVEQTVVLSKEQCASADQLVHTLISNWVALKNMASNNFKSMFLLRNARCSMNDNGFVIEVEPRAEDILLTKYPWGLGYISLPWLGKTLIEVIWKYGEF